MRSGWWHMLLLTDIIIEVFTPAMATCSNHDSKFHSFFFTYMTRLLSFQLLTQLSFPALLAHECCPGRMDSDKKWAD